MPRLVVILAALGILGAGAYGGLRGFQFTDLDVAPPAVMPAEVAVKPTAPPPPPAPSMDEVAVRELARAEIRGMIRPRRAAVSVPAPAAQEPTPPETLSAEPVEGPVAVPEAG